MQHPPGHLAANPLPAGIVGALGLGGYQLLAEIGGVGAGRLGPQAFLLVAPDPDPTLPDAGTQISLHQPRIRDEAEVSAFTQLAAQIGYLRLSGYKLALERHGLRSKVNLVNPATGAIAVTIPDRAGGRLFGGGVNASRLLPSVRGLPPAGPPPDTEDPELADRALLLTSGERALDPPAALEAAKKEE